MILYSTFYQKHFRIVWCGLTVARLQDNAGKTKLMSIADLNDLVKENATVTAAAH